MIKKKVFKVEFDIEPNKTEPLVKTVGICYWWNLETIHNPTVYVTATDIVSAMTKTLLNLDDFAKEVYVKVGYHICGIKGISEHYQEVYV